MSSIVSNEDLRSIKTEKALYAAMFSLLKKLSFRKITVKAICEEALISRAAFYSHFVDKYNLLKHCMTEVWSKIFGEGHSYEQIEDIVNSNASKNIRIFKNLICDADNETFEVLHSFVLSAQNLTIEKKQGAEAYCNQVVASNFYAGGIISYLLWQIKNRFPQDVPLMNKSLYKMIYGICDRS